MIIESGYRGDLPFADFRITADTAWRDAFFLSEITRPLPATWVRLRMIIRPLYDHPALVRDMTTDGDGDSYQEIIVDDADEAAFSLDVAQPVVQLWRESAAVFRHFLIAEYADPVDNREHWRGLLYVEPGLLP